MKQSTNIEVPSGFILPSLKLHAVQYLSTRSKKQAENSNVRLLKVEA